MDIFTGEHRRNIKYLIGGDPKSLKFVELFSAKKDKCDPAVFHEKCDNKGPTITLVYNAAGEIYGGYASISWLANSKQYFYDKNAFLFVLSNESGTDPIKFPVQNPPYAVLHEEDNGPTFGSGPDLLTFSGKVAENEDHTFSLNSTSNPVDYKSRPSALDTYINLESPAMDVIVYSIEDISDGILEIPWNSEPLFTESYFQDLLEETQQYWPIKDRGASEGSVDYVNILLIGPIGAGKSSFYNTINSVFRNRVTNGASAGNREKSVTMKFSMYSFPSNSDPRKKLRFRICDCRGLDSDFNIGRDIDAIVDGHVPHGFDLRITSFNERTPGYVRNPKLSDKIHCVAYVLDANNNTGESPFISSNNLEQIKEVMSKLDERGIPQRILLNKVDDACASTKLSTSSIFYSTVIRDRRIQAAKCLGLPPYTVLPMKNIYMESSISLEVKVLALYNLRNLLLAADDYLELNHLSELQDDKYESNFT